jgi:hypothetical protein
MGRTIEGLETIENNEDNGIASRTMENNGSQRNNAEMREGCCPK